MHFVLSTEAETAETDEVKVPRHGSIEDPGAGVAQGSRFSRIVYQYR